MAAFGLDERTVMDWQHRAGCHARAVHEAHIQPLALQQVQADEMRIKLQGRVVRWVALAIMVSTRLWLGTVVSEHRDSQLIGTLAALVRRWARQVALSTLKHATPALAAKLTDRVWPIADLLWYRPKPTVSPSTV